MIKLEKGANYREEKISGGVLFYRNDLGEKWKCRVRLRTGEVVEAVYDEPCRPGGKEHWVNTKKMGYMVATSAPYDPAIHVRFVGPSCDLVPVGVSV